jgi:hypothetical protein
MTYTLFHATDVIRIGDPDGEETERIGWFTPAEARAMLCKGQIVDGPTVTAVSFFLITRDSAVQRAG